MDDKCSGAEAFTGTGLETDWLRMRIAQLVVPSLVTHCWETTANGERLVIVDVPRNESTEPFAVTVSKRGGQRRTHRRGTQCVELATVAEMLAWAQGRSGLDWSAEPSGRPASDARASAVDALRDFLRESSEPDRAALADEDDVGVLGRLQLLRPDGRLTRAGELLTCGGSSARLRFTTRPALGAKSTTSVEIAGRGLTEELRAVLDAFRSSNSVIDLPGQGLAEGFVDELPFGAVREALMNAVMHRDWTRPGPIVIDHAHAQLVVHSPGPFLEGVTEETVLTAPSRTRNPSLGAALRSLRLVKREGTGVDRMYIEMVRLGHRPPTFAERDGGVRVVLRGGEPLPPVLRLHASLPANLRRSARTAVLIDVLRFRPSVTAQELAVAAQERPDDLLGFIEDSVAAGLLQPTAAPRRGGVPAWRLQDDHRVVLGSVLPYFARPGEESVRLIDGLAQSQGEIRNQDVQDLLGVTSARASQLLKRAEAEGVIRLGPGAKPTGRGTFYVPSRDVT